MYWILQEDLLILPCRHDIHEDHLLNTGLPLELVHKQLIMKCPQPNESENSRQEQMTVTKQEVLVSQLDTTGFQSLLLLEEPDVRHVKKEEDQ
jgi:hypothetical protein